jgi:outer membrane receptor for monomeric catechols
MQDTIDLTPYWKLVAGLRVDNFKADYDRPTGTPPNNGRLSRSDSLLSKRLGVMYQPTDEVSYYAAYGTSFNTSGDLYQFDPNSANTAPESSRNMEIGAKWELYGGDLSLRAALAAPRSTTSATPTSIPTPTPICCLASATPTRWSSRSPAVSRRNGMSLPALAS